MSFRNRKKDRPLKQEKQTATELGGKRQVASGAMPHAKGDVLTDCELVDNKTTEQKTFRLSLAEMRKHVLHARKKGLEPVFQVDMEAWPAGMRRWAVIPYDYFLELKERDDE